MAGRAFLVKLRKELQPAVDMAASGDVGAMWYKGVSEAVRQLDAEIEATASCFCGHERQYHGQPDSDACIMCECEGFEG